MISIDLWLGYKWNELSEELEKEGLAFSYQVISPPGCCRESDGDLRVVRFRKNAGNYDFILAHEKFSVLSI
jgi:hypothetical protein